jgi:hypothetical protein
VQFLTDDAPGVLDLPGAELTGEHPGQNLAAPVVLPVLSPAQQVRLRGCDETKWLARLPWPLGQAFNSNSRPAIQQDILW